MTDLLAQTVTVDVAVHMWFTFAMVVATLVLFANDRIPEELTSLGVIAVLMVFFHFFPLPARDEAGMLDPVRFLHGFSNSAVITVLALLVVGQGMVRTGVLERGANMVAGFSMGKGIGAVILTLVIVLVTSAFLNNIPVVVIFIPIMLSIAGRFNMSVSRVMMPLSFAAVLGGMTTLIGSGTNLLVSSALIELNQAPFTFFEFSIPGMVMAGAGLLFVIFVIPKLLPPERERVAGADDDEPVDVGGRQFICQVTVNADSPLNGAKSVGGMFPDIKDFTVSVIQRGETMIFPPFEDVTLQTGDIVLVAATRRAISEKLARNPEFFDQPVGFSPHAYSGNYEVPESWHKGDRVLAEVTVTPGSQLVGQIIHPTGYFLRPMCMVLGVQRRARMRRGRGNDIRLEAGDVLLVKGRPDAVQALRSERDILLSEWSTQELPASHRARRAVVAFVLVVGLAASGVLDVVAAALIGAVLMVATKVLTVRQAIRAVDSKIFTMIPAALALGVAMQETGGAMFLAQGMVGLLGDVGPVAVISAFFIMIAGLANVITSKATAVLFTPIAVSIAQQMGIDPHPFAIALVFAANCAFATPFGYQTSLLVMGPGRYVFNDFPKAGIPLILFLWVVFTLFVPWYYGLY